MVTLVGLKGSVKTIAHPISKGLAKHGDKFVLLDSLHDAHFADAYIQTNLLKPKIASSKEGPIYQYILDSKKPFLVNESPNFRRHIGWNRLGWYSYKWTDGLFGNENSPRDRWSKFEKETEIYFKDWNSPGDHILIMGQKEGDSSLIELYKKYESFYDWIEYIIHEIRKYSDRPIIVRPHPRNLRRGKKLANSLNKQKKLNIIISDNVESDASLNHGGDGIYDDFEKAYCVITYNSLSAVEAITEGIPTFAFDNGSMIWPVAHKDISQIENLSYDIDLTQWQNDIAYTQWTNKEHSRGESWEHLKPLIFGVNE